MRRRVYLRKEARQAREHGVPCLSCRKETWHVTGICDRCHAQHSKEIAFGIQEGFKW